MGDVEGKTRRLVGYEDDSTRGKMDQASGEEAKWAECMIEFKSHRYENPKSWVNEILPCPVTGHPTASIQYRSTQRHPFRRLGFTHAAAHPGRRARNQAARYAIKSMKELTLPA